MGRRSSFARRVADAYDTPESAVLPLLEHLPRSFTFCEPCAGDGQLVRILEANGGTCRAAYDIAPRAPGIPESDALLLDYADLNGAELIITNSPWTRALLHPLIVRLSDLLPTWLLLDANWLFTGQAVPYLPRLRRIVTVGRVRWIPGSLHTSKDDSVWLLFDRPSGELPRFYGRRRSAAGADEPLMAPTAAAVVKEA
jgi:hypothetical protein